MSETYRAVEIKKPGEWPAVRKALQDPGHEAVGRNDAFGSEVKGWAIEQLAENVLAVPRRRALLIGIRSAR